MHVLPGAAQSRLSILQAENRRAGTPRDLATLRAGARSGDAQTRLVAVRALGRLERPSLIPDIEPSIRHPLPEVRAEAADAIGQAAQGWDDRAAAEAGGLESAFGILAARLRLDDDADVRAAVTETLGRLPYSTAGEIAEAERALVEEAGRHDTITDRLGIALGFEALIRLHRSKHQPGGGAIALLRRYAIPDTAELASGTRIRRLAVTALIAADAVNEPVLTSAARDPDAQVRRLAMRAAADGGETAGAADADAVLAGGLADESPMVRFEALRALHERGGDGACAASLAAASDRDPHVALLALDQLSACGSSPDAVSLLERTATDLAGAASPRGWHRAAHALVALAAASPDRAAAALPRFTASGIEPLRRYAARAAAVLRDREALERLARDDDDNVREAAVAGLRQVEGHDADRIYVAELARPGNQIVRAAALALEGTPDGSAAGPVLAAAWQRLTAAGLDNSKDARDAILHTIESLGAKPPRAARSPAHADDPDLDPAALRRLASPRARVTIRGVGSFDLALFTSEAPATVLRFARLAEAGYYNGLTFHRVVPDFVVQGGSPGANEYVGDSPFMRDEVGLWPHVRGAVGISTRGRDTGDAQIFIDLVDNPKLDHVYTVFGQVLTGMDVVDQILEGDVIERIEILP